MLLNYMTGATVRRSELSNGLGRRSCRLGVPSDYSYPSADAAAASASMRAKSPAASASFGVSHEPPTQPTFGSARYFGADSGVMPPVGQNRSCGSGPPIDFR